MANLTINIPQAMIQRLQDAFGSATTAGRVPATQEDIRQAVIAYLRLRVRAYESNAAALAAMATISDVDIT